MQDKHKRRITIVVFMVFGLTYSQKILAQSSISLKDALTAADKNFPEVKAKMAYIQAAEQNIKEARREYIPSLVMGEQLSYATANSLPGTYFSYGLSISSSIGPKDLDNPNFGAISELYSTWPVFTFGTNRAKINLAQSQEKLAETDLGNDRFQLAAKTAAAYFDLTALLSLRKTAEQNLKRAETMRDLIRPLTINGLKPGVDSTTANAEVSKAKIVLLDAQKNEMLQRNYLSMLTGTDFTSQNLSDTATLQKLPPRLVADGSVANNPMLNYYVQQQSVNAARETLARRNYLPKIYLLGAAWGRGSGISPEAPNTVNPSFADGTDLTRFNYALGVEATFNILDYPRMSAQANAIHYQTLGLQQETDQQKLELESQLKDANDAYVSAYQKALESPILVTAARTAYSQKLAMYNAGLTNFTDLAQALYNLNDAEAQYAISYNNVWEALLYKALPTGDMTILLNQL